MAALQITRDEFGKLVGKELTNHEDIANWIRPIKKTAIEDTECPKCQRKINPKALRHFCPGFGK